MKLSKILILIAIIAVGCEKPQATMLKVINTDCFSHKIMVVSPKYAFYQDTIIIDTIAGYSGKDYVLRHGEYQILVEWRYQYFDPPNDPIPYIIIRKYDITVWDNISNTFNIPI